MWPIDDQVEFCLFLCNIWLWRSQTENNRSWQKLHDILLVKRVCVKWKNSWEPLNLYQSNCAAASKPALLIYDSGGLVLRQWIAALSWLVFIKRLHSLITHHMRGRLVGCTDRVTLGLLCVCVCVFVCVWQPSTFEDHPKIWCIPQGTRQKRCCTKYAGENKNLEQEGTYSPVLPCVCLSASNPFLKSLCRLSKFLPWGIWINCVPYNTFPQAGVKTQIWSFQRVPGFVTSCSFFSVNLIKLHLITSHSSERTLWYYMSPLWSCSKCICLNKINSFPFLSSAVVTNSCLRAIFANVSISSSTERHLLWTL